MVSTGERASGAGGRDLLDRRHRRSDRIGVIPHLGMFVAPCSARTLAEIASGAPSNLLTRAADVCLKERRRLVLMVRETPLHAGHLKAMLAATEAGAIIAPPVPAFYAKPNTLEDMVDHTIGRVLDLFDLDSGLVNRWAGRHTWGHVLKSRAMRRMQKAQLWR
jgi:polyprenyl P-hydroxybenzoate/phenylacrylic acid decarboxylase-like protein